jgi:hypothetical protein
MNVSRCISLTVLASCTFAPDIVESAPLVTLEQIERLLASPTSGIATDALTVRLSVAASIVMNVTFSITSKGNGSLRVPGASIRLYDGHQDGLVFEDALLSSEHVY